MPRSRGAAPRQVLVLIGLVLAIDAAALATYALANLGRAGPAARVSFVIAWTAATLAAVVVALRRVGSARRGRDGPR